MLTLPQVRVGDPIRHEALTVFPLFTETNGGLEYLLSDEAIESGSVTVEEVSESGSVPTLLVTNQGTSRVLFIEGEELRGAKQNRVLNTSVLVAAQSKTTIPVSCVEQGRWRYRSRQFGSVGTHASPKLRHVLKKSVLSSVVGGHGHTANQGQVWEEVSRQMHALGSRSETTAMADTYEAFQDRLADFRKRLAYVDGATGVAVAVGKQVVALDLFDKPATCRKAWDRLLTGVVMDALEAGQTVEVAGADDVGKLLQHVGAAEWKPSAAVGEGEELRTDAGQQTHGSALLFDGSMIHGSVSVGG
jgi:ARG and Rhodanese-Phosphatase-superfamily-associated Protein domain